ncbi:hypothetical protein GCK72_004718 [Caenorhabditis remanei]|uniref:Ig-like domain-containing protein n=1 Tax=Caenorhabditis remanei TaxID=31234 RepID=A0A6A5HAH4_CAERE|nr:hypothetical protein GCK72_004718 [Caenorhabditis remanei]KAF1764768.1 hypothetical protein GCK72_004718 [Caenorhabditis remanei]
MEGTSTGQRPYIRLTSQLRNATKSSGDEVRFKCEALGTPPLKFIWLKNKGAIEKSKRVKIRDKENSSRLVITQLDVLDSGYYQCIVTNSAASVNTTSVLRTDLGGVLHSRKVPGLEYVQNRLEDSNPKILEPRRHQKDLYRSRRRP